MMASILLSRVLGIVRDLIMAWMFGRDAFTDAYRLSFMIPDLLFFLIAGGALSSAFIPVFSEYLHTNREEEAWKIFSVVTTVMSLFVTGFIAVAWIFAQPLASVVAPGKTGEILTLIAHMSRILLPAQFAFFIGGILFGTLYARQRFVAPGLAPNIYNLGIICGALFLSGFFTPGIIGMSWGATIGAMIGNLLIPILVIRKLGCRFTFSLDMSHPGVKKVFKLMLPVVLGLSLPAVFGMIVQVFGTYYPAGANTALDLSNKLMQAPLGVFGQSLAIAVFPALTQFFAQDRMDLYRDQLARTMRTVIFLTMPVAALFIALAPEVIGGMLQYGKFKAADTQAVADCLRMFAIGIPAWCLHPVLMRAFFAVQSPTPPILIGTASTGLFVILSFVLKATPLGYLAFPLAGSITAVVMVIAMLVGAAKKTGGLDLSGVLKTTSVTAAAAAIAGGLAYGAAMLLGGGKAGIASVKALAIAGAIGLLTAWIYYFICRLAKLPETETVSRALSRFNRKQA